MIEQQIALEQNSLRKVTMVNDALVSITSSVVIPKAYLRLENSLKRRRYEKVIPRIPISWVQHNVSRKSDLIALLYVTWREIVTQASRYPSFESLSTEVGNAIAIEHKINRMTKGDHKRLVNIAKNTTANPYFRQKIFKGALGTDSIFSDSMFKKKMGSLFISFFQDFIKVVTKKSRGGKQLHTITLKPEIIELLLKYKDIEKPLYLPTIIPPRDPIDGFVGYYYLLKPLVTLNNYRNKPTKINLESIHYKALVYAQNQGFRINKEMWKVFDEAVGTQRFSGVAEFPHFHVEIPEKPWSTKEEYEELMATNPELVSTWKERARQAHKEQQSSTGKLIALAYLRNIANDYVNRDRFYMPMYLDFRGRMYYAPAYLNYQGNDWAKGLLEFSDGEPLTEDGFRWLKIAIANKAGLDKKTYEERLKWTEEHHDDIIRSAKYPFEYQWWVDMDEPWAWLKLAKAYTEYIENPYKPLHTIISVDGSNNGTQHLSAMLRSARGKYVNMTSENQVYDIYKMVAEATYDIVLNDKPEDEETERIRRWWLYGNNGNTYITRSLIKRPVMTKAYSVTFGGMVDQITDYMIKERIMKLPGVKDFTLIGYLVRKMEEALQMYMPVEAMDWLKEVAKVVLEKKRDITWETPSGFTVHQRYKRKKVVRVRTFIGTSEFHEYTNDTDNYKMLNAIAPNFVHSMDASHLAMVVYRFKTMYPFAPIAVQHDSFATHPNYMTQLQQVIRETFVELYSKDILREFKESLERRYKVKLPEPPMENNFDVREVLEAPYFFS